MLSLTYSLIIFTRSEAKNSITDTEEILIIHSLLPS